MRCSCGRDTHHETQVAIPVDTGLPSQTTVVVETTACPDCGRLAKPSAEFVMLPKALAFGSTRGPIADGIKFDFVQGGLG